MLFETMTARDDNAQYIMKSEIATKVNIFCYCVTAKARRDIALSIIAAKNSPRAE